MENSNNCCTCFKPVEKIEIPQILQKMNEIFVKNGFHAYLVGGAVRDMLMGKEISDWDVTTDAQPQDVMRIFKKVIPTGIDHGTVTVHFMKEEIEVTTFRTEGDYSDGRHPDKVYFNATLEQDLSRRDFTINAIAADLGTGEITDPFKGRQDIHHKIIRTVGNPLERFTEDGLRPVRAIRFSAKLGFQIEENTFFAIPACLDKTKNVSIERFRDEFCKMLLSPQPSLALNLMEHTGVMQIFLNEFLQARNCEQTDYRGFHKFDVLDHLYYAADGAALYAKDNLIVALAALFHDIGKVQAKKVDQNGKITFINHEIYSEKICRNIMTRLKFSNEQIEKTCHLVKEHMFHYEKNWSNAAIRRSIIRTKKECLEDLFLLRKCDLFGMYATKIEDCPEIKERGSLELLAELKTRISKELENSNALTLKELAVNGNDLISLGIKPGKEIGRILNELFQQVLENPDLNEKKQLLEKAKQLRISF